MLGLVFGVMLFFWLFGLVSTLLWYGIVLGFFGVVGYGGYRLFRKAEDKYVGGSVAGGYIEDRDFGLSWEEYDKKYLNK